MEAPLYRKISNVVIRKLSTALSFNDDTGMAVFNDTTLLNIFYYLPTSDLMCISQVCKRWNQLASHPKLWKNADLRSYSKALHDPTKLEYVAKAYLAYKIVSLDMSGFVIPLSVLKILATACPDLKKLVLKSVTFTKGDEEQVFFPSNLEYLDVRYSHGPMVVYEAIAQRLDHLQWLGMSDALLLALSNQQTQGFVSLQKLEKLDMTHCKLVKDNFLFKFCSCENLRLLSLRKCINIAGESLPVLIARLTGLETLILDGTSVQDEYLQLVDWKNTKLKYLELGWCPFITSEGLKSFLVNIGQISTLEYLGLCNIGQGLAVTDDNLQLFAEQLQQGTCPNLHSLNLSFSKNITDQGLNTFEDLHYIETLDVTKCAKISTDDENDDDEGLVFVASERKDSVGVFDVNYSNGIRRNNSRASVSSMDGVFKSRNDSRTSLSSMNDSYRSRNDSRTSLSSLGDDGMPRMRRRSSRGSFSTIQFALSNYTLETPL